MTEAEQASAVPLPPALEHAYRALIKLSMIPDMSTWPLESIKREHLARAEYAGRVVQDVAALASSPNPTQEAPDDR